jgi:1-phosphofructokinase
VTFNPALDYVVQVEDIKLGEVNRTISDQIYYGGKGINVSILLKTLEIDSVALGFIAGFTGREIEDSVKSAGISTDFITLANGYSRINVKMKSKVETELNAQGPSILPAELEGFFDKLDGLKSNDTIVLAGSIPSSIPDDVYEKIMERLEGKQVRIIVDATKDLLKRVLKYKPFLIKPNHHELAELFDVTISTQEEIIHYAKELQKLGAQNVLISMASAGAILIDEHVRVHIMGVPKGVVKNSVGAGDSMVAGFIAGYMKSGDYATALKVGTAAGSATAFSDGLATKELIEQLLQKL